MNMQSVLGVILLSGASRVAFAGVAALPEQGVMGLLAIGAVAAVIVAIRKRRK